MSNNFFFYREPVSSLVDIQKNLTPSSTNLTALDQLDTMEKILLLNNLNFPKRRYTLNEMLQSQKNLEILSLMESVKYKEYIVNARALIQKYLYSYGDFLSCNPLAAIPDTSLILTQLSMSTPLQYGHRRVFLKRDLFRTPSKTIRDYLTNYLTLLPRESNYTYSFFEYTPEIQARKKSTGRPQKRFYLPLLQSYEFLLSFIYYDGREFEEKNSNSKKLPHFDQQNSCSERAYNLIQKYFHQLFILDEPIKNSSDNKLTMARFLPSLFYRCDNIFLFFKLSILQQYFELYTSDLFLDNILKRYQLSYREVVFLQDTIKNTIFRDTIFIHAGLKSVFLDFMLLFDIYFQYQLFALPSYAGISFSSDSESSSISPKNEQNSFELCIEYCKKMACKHFEETTDFSIYSGMIDTISFDSNGQLDIEKLESNIMNQLSTNQFYEYYRTKRATPLPQGKEKLITFSEIKECLQIPLPLQ